MLPLVQTLQEFLKLANQHQGWLNRQALHLFRTQKMQFCGTLRGNVGEFGIHHDSEYIPRTAVAVQPVEPTIILPQPENAVAGLFPDL